MKLVLVVAWVCAACGSNQTASTPRRLVFERWSPAQPTSHDIFLAARGDVVVLAHRMSRDAGATWQELDTSLGVLTRVAITDRAIATYAASGPARIDIANGAVSLVVGAPAYASDRTWRIDPTTGRFIVFDAVENAIAVESASGWLTGTLPQPATTELRPYIRDIESNGSVMLAASAWGVHRSSDGASWQLVTASLPGAGRDLLVLADRRFALVGGTTTYVFDATGTATGTLASLHVNDSVATVCEDGSIVADTQVTRDLGATWQTLILGGDLQLSVQRAGCGGGRYWFLVISDAWGYRLVRYDSLTSPGVVAGNWEGVGDQLWTSGGPPIVRTDDGTFLVAGLALAPGASTWTLQEIPARTWASGSTLFGVAKQRFYTSYDGGVTWSATLANGLAAQEPEAFALQNGALHVSEFDGKREGEIDRWHSIVWRSSDSGATWTAAYDALATRAGDELVGEAHRFVGIHPDGAWIATDAVSHDGGATWTATDVDGDRGLAHLTRRGSLVTGNAAEELWRVYQDGGLGELTATYTIMVEGQTIPASQLRNVAFDEQGYAYTARGAPNVQIWRSNKPVE